MVAAVILEPAEAPSPSLAQLWPGPWLDNSSYTIYLTFYFGFPTPPLSVGEPLPFILLPWPGRVLVASVKLPAPSPLALRPWVGTGRVLLAV